MLFTNYNVVLCLCLLLFLPDVLSQSKQTDKPVFYSLAANYGYFQVHTKVLSPFRGSQPRGVELQVSQMLFTNKAKNTFGFYPKWALGLRYVNFGHPDLGYAVKGLAYFEPFLKVQGAWRFSVKAGMGVAYMSNPYDANSNPFNRTYSTKLAFPLSAGGSVYYFFNHKWALKTSVSFEHISNGGLRAPNLGINYPLMSLALEHTLDRYNANPIKSSGLLPKKQRQELLVAYSLKEDSLSNYQSLAMLFYNRSFAGGRINAFTVSGMIEYRQIHNDNKALDKWSIAPLIGNEFLLGKLRFGQQLGLYLLQAPEAPNNLFQHYYLRYFVDKRIVTGVALKAHGRVADYLAIQLGLVF
ncbi:acyloxyacyl hydrolase [Saccharicrinis carchari]|nr:acyloxyacyl hydrolase [Saccharicrinis carchari]